MTQFEKLTNSIEILKQEFEELATTLEFAEICEFKIEDTLNIPWEKLKVSGVYFIEIKSTSTYDNFPEWVANFRSEWESPLYKHKFVSNLKNKRIAQHAELKEWTPLYIGKSLNIKTRINEHIFLSLDRNTFALKLAAREHAKKETFRLSIIKVPYSTGYDWIMPVLESAMREKYNPLIGR